MRLINTLSAFALAVLSINSAQAATNVMTSSSAISLDVNSPSETIFVSYPGRLGDQCGLRLVVLRNFGSITAELTDKLVVKAGNRELPAIKKGQSIRYDFSEQVLGAQLFGLYVTIATADGQNLSTLSSGSGQLLVVSTPCSAAE